MTSRYSDLIQTLKGIANLNVNEEPQPDAGAVKFWTGFTSEEDSSKFSRLYLAIYDLIRNMTGDPPPQSANHSYLTPAMVMEAMELFGFDHFDIDGVKNLDRDTVDNLLKAYYKLQNVEFEVDTRKDGVGNGRPIIKRLDFGTLIALRMLGDPTDMCRRINAIFNNKSTTLIDPIEEKPFEYPKIPLICFPATNEHAKAAFDIFSQKWPAIRSQIIAESANKQSSSSTRSKPNQTSAPVALDSSPASRLAAWTGLGSSKPQSVAPQSAASPPATRPDQLIFAQMQSFRPLPGESEATSRARFNKILDGVDEAQMARLNVLAKQMQQQSELNLVNAMNQSSQMQAKAVADGFESQQYVLDIFGGATFEYKWVKK